LVFRLGITVKVEIGHDVPLGFTGGEGTTETEDFTSQHPPDETNSVTTLVVGGNGNINVFGRRVGVTQSNDGNVDI
jgi:hypothetical protein